MKYLKIIFILSLLKLIACDNPVDLNRTGEKLSGYITHIDSILYLSGGYYTVSLYNADSINPFNRVPIRTDSLNLKRRDWLYETTYTMEGITAGRYYVAATWSKYPKVQNEIPIVLGTYGCDTTYNCSNHKMILYPNYEGKFRNIFSWTDLGKRLY